MLVDVMVTTFNEADPTEQRTGTDRAGDGRSGGDVATWRCRYGMGAGLWAAGGRHVVEDDRWLAISGVGDVGSNQALVWSGEPGRIDSTVEDLLAEGVPGVVNLAGPALGWAQVMVDRSWVCVGALPFMRGRCDTLRLGAFDRRVRRLEEQDLAAGRALLGQAFGWTDEATEVALGVQAVDTTSASGFWGLEEDGELVAVAGLPVDGSSATLFSMACSPRHQGRGFGRSLLGSALQRVAEDGVGEVLLTASDSGLPLYRSMGFSMVEYWQRWSRPRWMMSPT